MLAKLLIRNSSGEDRPEPLELIFNNTVDSVVRSP